MMDMPSSQVGSHVATPAGGSILARTGRSAHTFYFNTINTLLFLSTLTKQTAHEGKYRGRTRKWVNWNREFCCQPLEYLQPATEEEICRAVAGAKRLRVVGGGHSFNASPVCEQTLLSLDNYRDILHVDRERKTARVQAGIRLRELGEKLSAYGLALPCLGSTNAQSIAGLISTDLHGTGRDHGFLSERALSLRIVDSSGRARTFGRDSAVFQAAFGGIGCAGVVTEVELQCVDSFRLRKTVKMISREEAENNTEQLLNESDHTSFYYLGSIKCEWVRMNSWNRTTDANSPGPVRHKLLTEVADMMFSGYIFGWARALGCVPATYRMVARLLPLAYNSRGFVMDWHRSFPRKLFFSHDEIELGIPYENFRPCIRELMDLLERRKFLSVVEVRFTPNCSRALLGPGVGRRTCYLELAPSLSQDPSEVFAEAEELLVRHGGQPHLGKKTVLDSHRMRMIYGERFDEFRKICREQDPEGKFSNRFTARLFGDAAASVAP